MLWAELYHHTGGDILSDSKVLQSVKLVYNNQGFSQNMIFDFKTIKEISFCHKFLFPISLRLDIINFNYLILWTLLNLIEVWNIKGLHR